LMIGLASHFPLSGFILRYQQWEQLIRYSLSLIFVILDVTVMRDSGTKQYWKLYVFGVAFCLHYGFNFLFNNDLNKVPTHACGQAPRHASGQSFSMPSLHKLSGVSIIRSNSSTRNLNSMQEHGSKTRQNCLRIVEVVNDYEDMISNIEKTESILGPIVPHPSRFHKDVKGQSVIMVDEAADTITNRLTGNRTGSTSFENGDRTSISMALLEKRRTTENICNSPAYVLPEMSLSMSADSDSKE
jgi:hypothetical protein